MLGTMRVKTQLQVVTGLLLFAGLGEVLGVATRTTALHWPYDLSTVLVIGGFFVAAVALMMRLRVGARCVLLVVFGAALLAMADVVVSAREQGELQMSLIARLLVGPLVRPAIVALLGFLWLGTARVQAALDRPGKKNEPR
jgi:uncharacterized membrane protein YwaF